MSAALSQPEMMSAADQLLEHQIDGAYREMLNAAGAGQRRAHFDRMAGLIKLRSPQRVAQMERERGLARS